MYKERKSSLKAEELYRLYEYAPDLEFPKLSMPCGTTKNYVKTGILTEEEERSLWKMKDIGKL